MKVIRYIVAVLSYLFTLIGVAVIVGLIMVLLFPPKNGGRVMIGVGMDWRNLPGTILGILAAKHSYRTAMKDPVTATEEPQAPLHEE